jgi:hypothetical protein
LKGEFESIVIRYCTLDPGNSGANLKVPQLYMDAVDSVPLAPTRLFVEAKMAFLDIQRSILGPVRTRNGGGIQSLNISDSIVQAIPENMGGDFVAEDLYDLASLGDILRRAPDPVSKFVRSALSDTTLVDAFDLGTGEPSGALRTQILGDLNVLIGGPSIYKATRFAQVRLSATTQAQIGKSLSATARKDFNRRLLTESYPAELADLALGTSSGTVSLQRTTVLGPIAVHRLNASECILDDVAVAEDQQHGCIRFTAYADGSVVHEPYESVTVAPQAALFRTRDFGRPNYARLKDDADLSITSGREGASILAGAENGSEMGAFALEKIPLKKRGLKQKFAEFMPIGLVPVWIDEPVLTQE